MTVEPGGLPCGTVTSCGGGDCTATCTGVSKGTGIKITRTSPVDDTYFYVEI